MHTHPQPAGGNAVSPTLCLRPQEARVARTRMTDALEINNNNNNKSTQPSREGAPAGKAQRAIDRSGRARDPEESEPPGTWRRAAAGHLQTPAAWGPLGSPRWRPAVRAKPAVTRCLRSPRRAAPQVPATRLPVPRTRAGPSRALSPQPARRRRRRVRPHLTATRTELSSGAPHMLAAGGQPGPWASAPQSGGAARGAALGRGGAGAGAAGRPAHLRRAPAMLGD